MNNTFVISDNHWQHHNIRILCNRPFESTQEMDDYMIDRWNTIVKPKDLVYHLGDFCWYSCDFEALLKQLHGQKILIKGNHDNKKLQKCSLWTAVKSEDKITVDSTHIHMYHYPIRDKEWNKGHNGSLHFHGHVHGKLPYIEGSWDVGVDNPTNIQLFDWSPIHIEDAIYLAQTGQPITKVP